MKWAQTLQELQAFVTRDSATTRTKFIVKILAILNFTKEHPELINKTGGSWMADGKHFITNSRILSELMKLKVNSINTNFRDHGFSIFPNGTAQMRTQFPGIPDISHWKIRVHLTLDFSSQTTLECANILPTSLCPLPAQKISFPFPIPKELIKSFLNTGINCAQIQNSLCKIYTSFKSLNQIHLNQQLFSNLVISLANTWKSEICAIPETSLNLFISYLINKQTMTITEEIKEQLKRNLVYILGNQESDILTFDTFVEFFIRYGYKNDFLQTIKELSYFDQNVNQSKANFVSWFSPIYKQIINVNDWMLNPSTEVVNAFSLYYKNEKGIVYTYIYHNPFDDDQSKRYFVLFEDGIKYAQSLVEMLKNVLNLKFESQKQINDEESPTYIRFADKIALRGQKKTVKVEDHFLNESEIQRFQWIEHLEENPLMF